MSGSNFGQPQPPLNPYGFSGAVSVSDRTWSGEYMTAAFDRARYKLGNVMGEPPVGPDQTYRTYAIINLLLGLAWLAMTVVALGTTGNFIGGVIWPIALIAGSSYWFKWHKASTPDEPAHAVQAWIGAIMRRK